MHRAFLHTIGILGALFAWSSSLAAQSFDGYYVAYPRAQAYPPSYYLPSPSYAPPPPNYVPAPNYVVPPDYHVPRAAAPYVGHYDTRAPGYASPPAVEYVLRRPC